MPKFVIKRKDYGTGVITWKNYDFASWSALFTYLDNQDTFSALEIMTQNSLIELDSNGSLFTTTYDNGTTFGSVFVKGTNLQSVNTFMVKQGWKPISIIKLV